MSRPVPSTVRRAVAGAVPGVMLAFVLASVLASGLALLPGAATAAELVQLVPSGCSSVLLRGTGLPRGQQLSVTLRDPRTRRELSRTTARATGSGRLDTAAPARLGAVTALEAEIAARGRTVLTATTELSRDQREACGATATALPFAGTARTLTLLAGGALLLLLGALLRSGTGYRGRHQPD